ncbi:MAG: cell division protein ZapA [Bacteroidales bacterium]|nr:cell division protein ZapA [Candidatus Cryptobacteroides aphodequi]
MTDEHKITVEVAGNKLQFNAKGPEMEQNMRRAADSINAALERYNALFPDQKLEMKLAAVALNSEMSKLQAQSRLYRGEQEAKALSLQLEDYLKKTNNR